MIDLFNYKKKLGQNFLIDNNIKNKIINCLNLSNNDIILELGAGSGNISDLLIREPVYKIFLIEIDVILFNILKKKFSSYTNVVIFHEDLLKFNFNIIFQKYSKFRIVGNIPYNISSKIIFLLIKISRYIKDIHLVVQKEFFNRLNHKKCSYLSVIVFYYYSVFKLFKIKPVSFFPNPTIVSFFVKLKPKRKIYILNVILFKNILKLFFKKKKKLHAIDVRIKIFFKYYDINSKPENITPNNFIRLINLLYITKLND